MTSPLSLYPDTKRTLSRLWPVLLTALSCLMLALPARALDLPATSDFNINATSDLKIYRDLSGKRDFYEVRSPRVKFVPYRGYRDLAVGGHKTYWLRLTVHNDSDQPRRAWVELDNPRLSSATLYAVSDGAVKIHEIDHRRAYGKYPGRLIYLPVDLDANATTELYLRVNNPWTANFPIFLRDQASHDAYSHFNLLLTGLFYGGLLLMMALAVQLFVALRNRLYLWFVSLTVISLINASIYDGMFAVLFKPDIYTTALPAVTPALFIAITLWYGRQFLWPEPVDDLYRRGITVAAGVAVFAAFIAPFSPATSWYLALLTSGVFGFLLLMFACLRKALAGEHTAAYLLTGFVLYGILTAPTASQWVFHLQTYTTDSLYKLGLLLLLFSATLAQGKLLVQLHQQLQDSIEARTRQQGLTRRAQQIARFADWHLRLDRPAWETEQWLSTIELCDATGRSYPSEDFFQRIHDDDRQGFIDALTAAASGHTELDYSYRFLGSDGELRDLHTRAIIEQDVRSGAWLACITHDQTAERTSQRLREQSEARWQALADATFEAIVVLRDGRICDVNSAAATVTGYDGSELVGASIDVLFPKDPELAAWIAGDHRDDSVLEASLHRADTSVLAVEMRCRAGVFEDGERVLLAIRDVDHHKSMTDQLRQLSYYDPLTEVANRNLLLERMGHAITGATRVHRLHAVLFIDLDHFKEVNDQYGHEFGDAVLVRVAQTMRKATRRENTLARIGGDEFVVLLEDILEPLVAAKVAEQLEESIHQPLSLEGRTVSLGASIGIAFFPRDGDTPDELLKMADTAMYEAKRAGGNSWQCYDNGMHERIRNQLRLDQQLHQAMASHTLPLQAAAICRFDDDRLLAADPYLNWRDGKTVYDEAELFEATEPLGMVQELGTYAIDLAVHLAHSAALSAVSLPVAAHLPAQLFSDDNFPALLRTHVGSSGVAPEQILLCVEQSALVQREETLYRLQRLRTEGYSLAIDYFGRRHLPLRLMQQLPVDYIRLCPAFAARTLTDAGERAILATVVELARQQDIAVCATGIRTDQQAERFAELGIACGSGSLYAGRVPAEDCTTTS